MLLLRYKGKRGGGVKFWPIWHYVIYGWPHLPGIFTFDNAGTEQGLITCNKRTEARYKCTEPIQMYRAYTNVLSLYKCTELIQTYRAYTNVQSLYKCTEPIQTY